MGGVVPAAGSVSACTCGSVADGTAEIVWGADVATWEASGAAGGAGAGSGSGGTESGDAGPGHNWCSTLHPLMQLRLYEPRCRCIN